MKTISDKSKTFTFTYEFQDYETARIAGSALMGYMVGTYYQPTIEITYIENGVIAVEYLADKKLNKIFNRICDAFNQPMTEE